MANPNKGARGFMRDTAEKLRESETPCPVSPFVEWIAAQARAGASFNTLEAAQAAYEKEQ